MLGAIVLDELVGLVIPDVLVEAEIGFVDRRIGGPRVIPEDGGREQLVMPGHPRHIVMTRDDPCLIGLVPMYGILVAQPTIIGIGIDDDIRGEHVILNGSNHDPPSSKRSSVVPAKAGIQGPWGLDARPLFKPGAGSGPPLSRGRRTKG